MHIPPIVLTAADLLMSAGNGQPDGFVLEHVVSETVSDLDLDARLYRQIGSDVAFLVLPGSDSWRDWWWNLLPGEVRTPGGRTHWREAFYREAEVLSERLHTVLAARRAVYVAGHSRGAAVGYTLAHAFAGAVPFAGLTLFGSPMPVRHPPRSYPIVPTWRVVGRFDLVARAPLSRLVGYRLPATVRIDLPCRHSMQSYHRALQRRASP